MPEFSRNNGRISSKSLEKSLDGVNTARLQPGDFRLTDLCQREREREGEHRDTWNSRQHSKNTDAQLQIGVYSSVNS